jgi:hypothetical protein
VCFLPCPPNIVTALANGAMQGVGQARELVSGVSNRSQAWLQAKLVEFQGLPKLQTSISRLIDVLERF